MLHLEPLFLAHPTMYGMFAKTQIVVEKKSDTHRKYR